jgi:ribosomal protein L14E/L6E/L27E
MKKYQRGPQGGASTLISLASSEKTVPDRKPRPADEGGPIDRLTGKRVYVETGKEYYNGKQKTVKIEKLALTDDAHSLSSGRPIEHVYAEYSNKLKALANMSRKEMLETKDIEYSPRANKAYAEEVKMLQANLNNALRNAPLERQAQVIANARFRLKKEANPEMDKAEIKKLKSKELEDARRRVGAGKDLVTIEPKEWEAIQAGAITKTMLNKILDNADVEKIKKLATPREKPAMNEADLSRARLMLIGDKHTLAEVANQLGVSVDTLKSAIAGDS